jgi:hypothetical protein
MILAQIGMDLPFGLIRPISHNQEFQFVRIAGLQNLKPALRAFSFAELDILSAYALNGVDQPLGFLGLPGPLINAPRLAWGFLMPSEAIRAAFCWGIPTRLAMEGLWAAASNSRC